MRNALYRNIPILFTPPQNVSKLTVLPVQLLMDIMSISS